MLNYLFISSLFLLTSPFSVGQTKSYERYYSAEHLRQHPGQEITWIKMSIQKCGLNVDYCIGEYGMNLSVGLKNRKEAYGAYGVCHKHLDSQKIPYFRCGILCDGGGFKVYGDSKVRLIPDDTFRVRLPGQDEGLNFGKPNPEHLEFVLFQK